MEGRLCAVTSERCDEWHAISKHTRSSHLRKGMCCDENRCPSNNKTARLTLVLSC